MASDQRSTSSGRGVRTGSSRLVRWDALLAVAAGGALGAPARVEVARLVHVAPGGFPWATFWTNVSGSLVLGFALVVMIERFAPSRYARPFFAIGFLGSYTTFSTFIVEADDLVRTGHAATGVTYALVSVLAGVVAAWVGIAAARLLPAVRPARRGRRRN